MAMRLTLHNYQNGSKPKKLMTPNNGENVEKQELPFIATATLGASYTAKS